MGNFNFTMEVITKDNGETIKCKDKVKCTIQQEKQPIRGVGKKAVLMAMDKFSMTLLNIFIRPLTLETLPKFKIDGSAMKANFKMIPNMVKEK